MKKLTVFCFMLLVSIAAALEIQAQTRKPAPKFDSMTIELADADFPKVVIKAEAGTLMYVFDHLGESTLGQIGILAGPECERIDCNGFEITVKIDPKHQGFSMALTNDPRAKPAKHARYRPVMIQITFSGQPPEPAPKSLISGYAPTPGRQNNG